MGIGTGMTFSSVSLLTSFTVDFKDHAVAQGIVAQMRVLGGSIGVAMANGLVTRQSRADLRGILTVEQVGELQTSTKILETLDAVQRQAVRQVYSDAFSTTMRICTYLAAVCLVVSFFTFRRDMNTATNARERNKRDGAEKAAGGA